MRNKFIATIILLAGLVPALAFAQNENLLPDEQPGEEFYRATVLQVLEENLVDAGDSKVLTQKVKVRLDSGDLKGSEIEIQNDGVFTVNGGQGVEAGEKILVYRVTVQGEDVYYIADNYRIPAIMIVLGVFFLVAVIFARWKGVTSILGLGVTILIIVKFVVPQIIDGKNPILISLVAALAIALVSVYLSHGFNKRTSVAIIGILITLSVSAVLSIIFVSMSKLFGLGSEQAFYLQFGPLEDLNLRGLLLGGIILGVLGVLDDVTTTQAATVDELKKANPSMTFKQLYAAGSSVGREHITSLVNTLFLAYAGAGLPLFLFFTAQNPQPAWVTINAEFIAEEIIRTLVGSIGLILAVPITTLLAAYYFSKKGPSGVETNHVH